MAHTLSLLNKKFFSRQLICSFHRPIHYHVKLIFSIQIEMMLNVKWHGPTWFSEFLNLLHVNFSKPVYMYVTILLIILRGSLNIRWYSQTFRQDYGLASHTFHVVCVSFICKWRDLRFNDDSERLFLRNFLMAGLFTLRVFAIDLLRGNRQRNIFFIFRFDVWPGTRTQALSLKRQHTTCWITAI